MIKKTIGNIEPYGDSNIDEYRSKNLDTYISLTDDIIYDLIKVAKFRNRPEYSMKDMGIKAYNQLLELKEIIENEINN